jgi:hypothetical protein
MSAGQLVKYMLWLDLDITRMFLTPGRIGQAEQW